MNGNLVINVFDETVANPVVGAKVDIFENDKQIESLTTNISGQTETITLDAPPGELSMVPQDEERPFSTYDIRITAEGLETLTINGVEIFDGTTAIQNATLGETQNIYVPDNTLWEPTAPKIPEDEVKPLPEASGYVVLNEVVVPEFIVVHAGLPSNESAPNYWVPFKDYIKNVASSEIYSTWPKSTIQANVLAIISFTLNRVFTEWYRGQGKNFTITNSTE
ncbi:MAG: carboxypeptidase regulatory-like domain-containing protein [Defluviitaleaceae bacterium]|nr:carboxypeptidase regulatory-like domain-containing protein [Defluviitaleaceae bacterium]